MERSFPEGSGVGNGVISVFVRRQRHCLLVLTSRYALILAKGAREKKVVISQIRPAGRERIASADVTSRGL